MTFKDEQTQRCQEWKQSIYIQLIWGKFNGIWNVYDLWKMLMTSFVINSNKTKWKKTKSSINHIQFWFLWSAHPKT